MERPTHLLPFTLTMFSGFLLVKLTFATSRRKTGTREFMEDGADPPEAAETFAADCLYEITMLFRSFSLARSEVPLIMYRLPISTMLPPETLRFMLMIC